MEDPGRGKSGRWGLAGCREPETSQEPRGFYHNLCPFGWHDRRQEDLVARSLGSGPSFATSLSAVCLQAV